MVDSTINAAKTVLGDLWVCRLLGVIKRNFRHLTVSAFVLLYKIQSNPMSITEAGQGLYFRLFLKFKIQKHK